MCNLSDGVYLDGVKRGVMQGRTEGAENKQLEMLKQFISNNHTFDEFIKLFNITDKSEIEFLKLNINN